MAALQFESQPSSEPVSLDEMKSFLRVEIANDDTLIATLITAARELCETFTGRSFVKRKLRQGIDSFPYFADTVLSQNSMPPSYYSLPRYSTTLWNYSQMIKLFRPPVLSVDRISYLASVDKQWHSLLPGSPQWYTGRIYKIGDQITDGDADIQTCAAPGTSDDEAPVWNKTLGGTTTETGGVAWTNGGPAPANQFLADTDSEPVRIFPGPAGATWPAVIYAPGVVQIHYTSGYDSTINGKPIPASAKVAIMQCVANWYENREAAMQGSFNELPNHCKALLWGIRIYDFQTTRG